MSTKILPLLKLIFFLSLLKDSKTPSISIQIYSFPQNLWVPKVHTHFSSTKMSAQTAQRCRFFIGLIWQVLCAHPPVVYELLGLKNGKIGQTVFRTIIVSFYLQVILARSNRCRARPSRRWLIRNMESGGLDFGIEFVE